MRAIDKAWVCAGFAAVVLRDSELQSINQLSALVCCFVLCLSSMIAGE